MTKPKKIFIGLTDIASFISEWDYGFSQLGVNTYKGSSHHQHLLNSSKLDFVVEKSKNRMRSLLPGERIIPGKIGKSIGSRRDRKVEEYYFKKALKDCDIFLFIWNSFKTDYSDYKILKQSGKKIVTLFVGDDTRWYYAAKQEFEELKISALEYDKYDYSLRNLERKLRYLRMSEKYSDIILSKPSQSQLALKPYFNIFIPITASKLGVNTRQREIPVIIHAPTSPTIKGSKFIGPIIEKLKAEKLKFEFKLIQNMPHNQALKEYLNADIIIDQLILPGGGALAHECLSMGKIVLTLMAYSKYNQKKPDDCPIIDVDPNNLYDVLKSIIPNHNMRVEIAKKGPLYIQKYHTPASTAKRVLDLLSTPEEERIPDYYPDFFRNKLIPESEESIGIYNKWTASVKDCDWYKRYTSSGERAGLLF